MWLVSNLRNFQEATQMFVGATEVNKIDNLILKKNVSPVSHYYGMFDNSELVGYFWLVNMQGHHSAFKAYEFHIKDSLRGRGLGMFFYKHILLEEKNIIVSDFIQTTPSRYNWKKIQKIPNVTVGIYNAVTDKFDFSSKIDEKEIYSCDYLQLAAKFIAI